MRSRPTEAGSVPVSALAISAYPVVPRGPSERSEVRASCHSDRQPTSQQPMAKNRVRVIPLGGSGEVGRNMWVLEYGDEILVLDCGVMFPEAEMLGVDLVLPDITYLREQKEKIQAILLTHGHEDHIGAIPHLLADLGFPPIYGTPLTLGIVTGKLKQHRLLDRARLVRFQAGEKFSVGSFSVEPFHVAHSIPDTVGFGITTPAGLAIYLTGWKFDHAL